MTARAINTDFFQNFRYHLRLIGGSPVGEVFNKPEAGFNTLTIPELTMDAVEYREGTSVYTKKFGGIPTFSEVTLTRGVTKDDSDFWRWGSRAAAGGEYRADVNIMHFSREDAGKGNLASSSDASRIYTCLGCVPIRVKLTSDMDATSGDVSIAELGLAVEEVQLRINNELVT